MPTAIIDTPEGVQIGVWRLEPTQVVTFDPAGSDELEWDHRSLAIDFRFHHKDDKSLALARDKVLKKGAAVVVLAGGELAVPDLVQEKVKLTRTKAVVSAGPFARTVAWTRTGENLALKIVYGHEHIQLLPNATATITNAAPVPSGAGLDHFAHYYEAFKDKPGADRVLALQAPARTRDDVPVYDCIPPTGGPDPEP